MVFIIIGQVRKYNSNSKHLFDFLDNILPIIKNNMTFISMLGHYMREHSHEKAQHSIM